MKNLINLTHIKFYTFYFLISLDVDLDLVYVYWYTGDTFVIDLKLVNMCADVVDKILGVSGGISWVVSYVFYRLYRSRTETARQVRVCDLF